MSKISIFGAVLILMGHSLFPHNHEDDPHCLPEVGEDTIIHILSHVFEQDLGIDHLENFISSIQTSISGPSKRIIPIGNYNWINISISESAKTSVLYVNCYKPVELTSTRPPRSPPLV